MPEPEELTTEERVESSVRRLPANLGIVVVLAAAIGGWSYFGFDQLEPGHAALLLRFDRHVGTVTQEGLHWTLPPPLVELAVVNVGELRNVDFGFSGRESEGTPREKAARSEHAPFGREQRLRAARQPDEVSLLFTFQSVATCGRVPAVTRDSDRERRSVRGSPPTIFLRAARIRCCPRGQVWIASMTWSS